MAKSSDYVANSANFASLVYRAFHDTYGTKSVNWVGFYFARPLTKRTQEEEVVKFRYPFKNVLVLGPFHGKAAVTTIPYKQGVCGTCANELQLQLVEDVENHPNHIVCDGDSKSELVVPLFRPKLSSTSTDATSDEKSKSDLEGRFVGMLDMDSPVLSLFTEEDAKQFTDLCQILVDSCDWPSVESTTAVNASLVDKLYKTGVACSASKSH